MADRDHAPLPADYADRDVEQLRRERNQRRRPARRMRSRERWLAKMAEIDPAAHAELVAMKGENPQAYRKRLVRLAKKHGFYTPFDEYGPRELDPLYARRDAEDSTPPAPAPEATAEKAKRGKKKG